MSTYELRWPTRLFTFEERTLEDLAEVLRRAARLFEMMRDAGVRFDREGSSEEYVRLVTENPAVARHLQMEEETDEETALARDAPRYRLAQGQEMIDGLKDRDVMLERTQPLTFRCDRCGHTWEPTLACNSDETLVPRTGRLPFDGWQCPEGCNPHLAKEHG